MNCFAGIDIGSTSIKIVLIEPDDTIIGHITRPTGSHFHKNTKEALGHLLDKSNLLEQDVNYMVATGYGRKLSRRPMNPSVRLQQTVLEQKQLVLIQVQFVP